jgi:hypothetical protein
MFHSSRGEYGRYERDTQAGAIKACHEKPAESNA